MASAIGLTPNRIVVLIALILIGYFAVIGASNALHNASLAREQRQLEADMNNIQGQIEQASKVKDYVRSDEYIEGVARNELNLVRPGEVLVKVVPATPTPSEQDDGQAPRPWWERLFSH